MFKLMALLCAGIFLAMVIGGQDRGQVRFGLMSETDEKASAVPLIARETAESAVVEAAFVPEKPVMVQPAPVEAPVEAVAEVAPAAMAAPLDAKVMFVAAASANVRDGPGKDHAVIGRLSEGEAVLVVVDGEGPEGWSLIRIEGDGLEGYIASRLLTE